MLGFHAILNNPQLGYLPLAQLLIQEKVPYLQLRMPEATHQELQDTAKQIVQLTRGTSSLLILHDAPQLAKEIGAGGVHLSRRGGITYQQAREIVGKELLVGLSCLTVQQVIEAKSLKPDYIGMGPIFATPHNPDTPIGLEGLKQMLQVNSLHCLAIGGIDLNNMSAVLSTGIKSLCVIRQLNDSHNPRAVLEQIKGLMPFWMGE